MSWINEMIEKGIQAIEESKNYPGYFGVTAINNIPYISFPGMSESENLFIHDQVKRVMVASRNLYNFKEVSAIFNLHNNNKNDVLITKGNYKKVDIFKDDRVKKLVNDSNRNKDILIVNIHNHPASGIFSVNDLVIFTENPSIKLMMISNQKGEVSFLLRPDFMELSGVVLNHLTDVVPDIKNRIIKWKKDHPDKDEYDISDIIDKNEANRIVKLSLATLQQFGIDYCPYADQKKADLFEFKEVFDVKQQVIANNVLRKMDKHLSEDDNDMTEAIEGGEDGYEQEDPALKS